MKVSGEVTLPDGRNVFAVEAYIPDPATNGMDSTGIEIEWLDGDMLTSDEFHESIAGIFLHEWVSEKLAETGEWENYPDYE